MQRIQNPVSLCCTLQIEALDPLLQLLDSAPRVHDVDLEIDIGGGSVSSSGSGFSKGVTGHKESQSEDSDSRGGGGVSDSVALAAQHHRQLLSLCLVFARRGLHCLSDALPG